MATSIDWDTEFTEESAKGASSDFALLADGIYNYEVKKLEKDMYTAGPDSKIPSCPKAVVHVLVEDAFGNANYWKENIFLFDDNKWRILRLFTSAGLRRHGDGKTRIPWNDLVGCKGRAKIGHRANKNDPSKVYNQVVEWLDPIPAEDDEY